MSFNEKKFYRVWNKKDNDYESGSQQNKHGFYMTIKSCERKINEISDFWDTRDKRYVKDDFEIRECEINVIKVMNND